MASRMVRDASVPDTPDQLDAWIAAEPETHQTMREGGYGTEFTAADLLPLLAVFVEQAGGRAAPTSAEPAPRTAVGRWRPVAVIAVVVLLAAALALGMLQ